jgi:hypothetical protein
MFGEFMEKSVLAQKLTNMSTHNKNTQVTCRFDSNQDPNKYGIVYLVYEYDNNKEKKICNPDSSKDFP